MTLIPQIDESACLAHGDCAVLAPQVFALEQDVAVVIGDGPDALVRPAARACPAGAILLVDRDTGEEVE
jgi:ferredoxin